MEAALVLKTWAQLCAVLDKFAASAAAEVLRRQKYLVAEKINIQCGNDESLSAYDVEIYDAYKRIIAVYGEVVGIYLDKELPTISPAAASVWDGVYAVLMSRMMLNSEKKSDEDFVNPVAAEKREIVARQVLLVSQNLDEICAQIAAAHSFDLRNLLTYENLEFELVAESLDKIANTIRRAAGPAFYRAYVEGAEQALAGLNDLSSRIDANYYYELLRAEQDILRQITVVQMAALEEDALQGALNLLREAYQRASAEIQRFDSFFGEVRAKPDVENEEEFVAEMTEIAPFGEDLPMVFEALKQEVAAKRTAFAKAAQTVMDGRLDTIEGRMKMTKMYFSKKAVSEAALMVREARRCFGALLAYFEENKEALAVCGDKEIIAGVAETILIKTESLDEALEGFEEEASEVLGTFAHVEISRADLAEAFAAALIFGLTEADEANEVVLDDAMAAVILADHREMAEKALAKCEANIDKKIMTFKRDSFLFELTTFEEIMYYSVSRLRASDDADVLAFVAQVDICHKKLGDCLTKYGIEKIMPQPHDVFNPKENEVLMAEVDENFKKGEIIKTMNAGYRIGDLVIVRANVIAAK